MATKTSKNRQFTVTFTLRTLKDEVMDDPKRVKEQIEDFIKCNLQAYASTSWYERDVVPANVKVTSKLI